MPPAAAKSKLAIFSIKVTAKVIKSLTLVSFEGVSFVDYMPNMKLLSLTLQSYDQCYFCHRQTDKTKTKCPQIPFRGA